MPGDRGVHTPAIGAWSGCSTAVGARSDATGARNERFRAAPRSTRVSVRVALAVLAALLAGVPCVRARARGARRRARLLVEPYRADRRHAEGLVAALDT